MQGALEEVLELGRPLGVVLQRRARLRRDEQQRTQRRLVQVWRLSLSHLNGRDSQAPHVYLCVIFQASDELRRHPIRRSYDGAPLVLLLRQAYCKAEVGNLHRAVEAHQDIVRLDVAVQAVLAARAKL